NGGYPERVKRAVATVVATRRSAPRPVGSKLLVGEDGAMQGSVSGGCVESEVYEVCRGVLRGEAPRLLTYGISDEQAFEVDFRAAARSTCSSRRTTRTSTSGSETVEPSST